ncbi:hypothetical protein PPERSA_06039 [Pseudocohnilembus persalinus]|uniref:Uncharacterized protein n=1 Tax=Pseudocohnilembus persalinus TaxID=266149 RepID=A0A0V0QQG7_PSEPJ|nr:hypothetical protein PPERSA_06039 [Pseudocohnilembus persalinus]|eukprot:KRX04486.1 hypothetical protein PPERSA_06039 [Pseudocohnilembus persalinus]
MLNQYNTTLTQLNSENSLEHYITDNFDNSMQYTSLNHQSTCQANLNQKNSNAFQVNSPYLATQDNMVYENQISDSNIKECVQSQNLNSKQQPSIVSNDSIHSCKTLKILQEQQAAERIHQNFVTQNLNLPHLNPVQYKENFEYPCNQTYPEPTYPEKQIAQNNQHQILSQSQNQNQIELQYTHVQQDQQFKYKNLNNCSINSNNINNINNINSPITKTDKFSYNTYISQDLSLQYNLNLNDINNLQLQTQCEEPIFNQYSMQQQQQNNLLNIQKDEEDDIYFNGELQNQFGFENFQELQQQNQFDIQSQYQQAQQYNQQQINFKQQNQDKSMSYCQNEFQLQNEDIKNYSFSVNNKNKNSCLKQQQGQQQTQLQKQILKATQLEEQNKIIFQQDIVKENQQSIQLKYESNNINSNNSNQQSSNSNIKNDFSTNNIKINNNNLKGNFGLKLKRKEKLNTSHVPNNIINLLTKYLIPLYTETIKCQFNPNLKYKTHQQLLKENNCQCDRCLELKKIVQVKYCTKKNLSIFKSMVTFSKRMQILIENYIVNASASVLLQKQFFYRSEHSFKAMYQTLHSFLGGCRNPENFNNLI